MTDQPPPPPFQEEFSGGVRWALGSGQRSKAMGRRLAGSGPGEGEGKGRWQEGCGRGRGSGSGGGKGSSAGQAVMKAPRRAAWAASRAV